MLMLLQISQIFHQIAFLFCSQNQIDSLNICYLSRLQLRITSSHYDKSSRMLFCQTMNSLTAFFICHFSDRTGINYTNISLLTFTYGTDSYFLKHFSNGRSFRKVQFTA